MEFGTVMTKTLFKDTALALYSKWYLQKGLPFLEILLKNKPSYYIITNRTYLTNPREISTHSSYLQNTNAKTHKYTKDLFLSNHQHLRMIHLNCTQSDVLTETEDWFRFISHPRAEKQKMAFISQRYSWCDHKKTIVLLNSTNLIPDMNHREFEMKEPLSFMKEFSKKIAQFEAKE
jgi:hypothetical protein